MLHMEKEYIFIEGIKDRSEFDVPENRVPETDHPHALLDLLLLLVDDDREHGRHELTQAHDDVERYDGAQDVSAA